LGSRHNILGVLKEVLTTIGTGSVFVVFWGYLVLQEPTRSLGTSLPFSVQDYYVAGLRPLGILGPFILVGMSYGFGRTLDDKILRAGQRSYILNFVIPVIGIFTLNAVSDLSFLATPLRSFFVGVISIILASYVVGVSVGILVLYSQDADAVALADTVVSKVDELRKRLASEDPTSIHYLLSARVLEDPALAILQDSQKDGKIQKKTTLTWVGAYLILAVTFGMFVAQITWFVRNDASFTQNSKAPRIVQVVTKTQIPEFSVPGIQISPSEYQVQLIAKTDKELFLKAVGGKAIVVIPTGELVRMVYP
jgi:hypothetical protein